MRSLTPADLDSVATFLGRDAQLILTFGPYAQFTVVTIDAVLPDEGLIRFRDYRGAQLAVAPADIESLYVYPAP